eukprot:scaffold7023_cov15-Tisochrysis_lutea.AAC.1
MQRWGRPHCGPPAGCQGLPAIGPCGTGQRAGSVQARRSKAARGGRRGGWRTGVGVAFTSCMRRSLCLC